MRRAGVPPRAYDAAMHPSRLVVSIAAVAALFPATIMAATYVAPRTTDTVSPTRSVTSIPSSSSASSSSITSATTPSYRSSTPAIIATPKKVRDTAIVAGSALFDADGNSCPTVSTAMPAFPAPVYDVAKGDCSLKGKGAQVTAYLKKLKKIADGCKKEVPAQWKKAKQTKKNLEATVDGLPSPEPDVHFFAASPSCNDFSIQDTGALDIDGAADKKSQYSTWLKKITDDTAAYCAMVHQIVKPLADACASMAEETRCLLTMQTANGVSDAQKKAYRSTITLSMKAATQKYNSLDSFYKNTLSKNGWTAFTSLYKESNVVCGNSSDLGKDSYTKEEE